MFDAWSLGVHSRDRVGGRLCPLKAGREAERVNREEAVSLAIQGTGTGVTLSAGHSVLVAGGFLVSVAQYTFMGSYSVLLLRGLEDV